VILIGCHDKTFEYSLQHRKFNGSHAVILIGCHDKTFEYSLQHRTFNGSHGVYEHIAESWLVNNKK